MRAVVFDFDGVFTDNTVWINQKGEESVRCYRSDGLGLSRLRAAGLELLILSTEKNPVVSVRAKKLQIPCVQGVEDKAAAIRVWANDNNYKLSELAFVGNDINDIPALEIVGCPIGVADCFPEIIPFIKHRTKKPGGFGAVREICDTILKIRTQSGD